MTSPQHQHIILSVRDRRVPMAWWVPADAAGQCPLVLVCHGGSGHKTSSLVLDIVKRMLPAGIAVAAIDGPVHGERRSVFADGPLVRDEFRELWSQGGAVDAMVEDWQSALSHLCQVAAIDPVRVAWYGISMGTAYGVPVVSADRRIKAAVLGMWGTCRAPSERLIADAQNIDVPVLFQVKRDDAIFTPQGQQHLFNQVASAQKHFVTYDGGHVDPSGVQLDDIADFLQAHLRA
jgi:dienelactone hydrolase